MSTAKATGEGKKAGMKEEPDYIKALPPKLREAWLAGEFEWDGRRLQDREPVAKTKPGKSVAALIAQGKR